MKTRKFPQIVLMTCCSILICGCQSGPFSRRALKNDSLAQGTVEEKEESEIQKNLREAMAAERKKGQIERMQRNGELPAAESLAADLSQDETLSRVAAKVESQALPLNSPVKTMTPQVSMEADEARVMKELNLAYDADRVGNFEKAQGYYQRVLAMDADNFEALHRLAIIEDKKQNYPAAEAYYLSALKLDPSNSDLLSDIGYSYMLQGRDDYGERYLREALKYQPGHVRSLDHLGWYYGRSGEYEQAMALFRMTGTEAQAKLKFAQLFPEAAPGQQQSTQGNMLAQQRPQPVQNQNSPSMGAVERPAPQIQRVEQVQTEYPQPVQYAAPQIQQPPVEQIAPQMENNPTLQIAEMMKREREKAIQARNANQQMPSINPNQALARQPVEVPAPSTHYQQAQTYQPAPAAAPRQVQAPVTESNQMQSNQIQAWPPVGDPGIDQAVQATNYWALKEQQQNQYQQQPQQQNQDPRQLRSAPSPQRQMQGQPSRNPIAQQFPQQQSGALQNRFPNGQQMQGQQTPQQQLMHGNVPHAGQPLYGNQYQVPGQFPYSQMNSTQSPAPQSQAVTENRQQQTDQDLIREAARTGMNLGPGQMFPVTAGNSNPNQGSPSMSTQMHAGTIIPASAQVPEQNAFLPGGQNIRHAQVGQPIYSQQTAGGIRQAGYEYDHQANPHGAVTNASLQYQGVQQVPSQLPQSVMYSSNPAVAPANVRTVNTDQNQGSQQNGYPQNGYRGQVQNGLMNQSAAPQSSSPFQWGADQPATQQQPASRYHFPAQ